jgi:hypothetical protein
MVITLEAGNVSGLWLGDGVFDDPFFDVHRHASQDSSCRNLDDLVGLKQPSQKTKRTSIKLCPFAMTIRVTLIQP